MAEPDYDTTINGNAFSSPLVHAAERRAALRTWLLSTGYFTFDTLAELRNSSINGARAYAARERSANRLFTVKCGARTCIPAFLIDGGGRRVSQVCRAVEILRPLGLDGWALWGWLAAPSGWLSGEVPAKVVIGDPGRGLAAVNAYASSLDIPAVSKAG